MKIDIRDIIGAHFRTLRNARNDRISVLDLLIFYGLPALVAVFVGYCGQRFPDSFYGLAISVFSIFAALLFSVQIALFSIFQRDIKFKGASNPEKLQKAHDDDINDRRNLIREVNANISYLILIASAGVAVLLAFSLTKLFTLERSIISAFLVSHFVLTIILVVARVHTLFDEEYGRV